MALLLSSIFHGGSSQRVEAWGQEGALHLTSKENVHAGEQEAFLPAEFILTAIKRAGLEPGRDAALALDVASSHFYRDGRYRIKDEALPSAV